MAKYKFDVEGFNRAEKRKLGWRNKNPNGRVLRAPRHIVRRRPERG